MGLISGIYNLITKKEENKTALITEEDILRAIDDLPDKTMPNKSNTELYEGASLVKVPKPKSWSDFKYLGKPEYRGLSYIEMDPRVYFTIPCGFEWQEGQTRYWFITFPLNGDYEEVQEFFTLATLEADK